MLRVVKFISFAVVPVAFCAAILYFLLSGTIQLLDDSNNRVIKVSCYSNNELKYLAYTKHVSISGDSINEKPKFDKCILEDINSNEIK